MSENGRAAVVTGAAGGIGVQLVRGLLGAGMRVAAADRDRGRLAALAAEHETEALLTIEADLARDEGAQAIVAAATARFGEIDILVNNAGVGPGAIRADSWQNPLKFWEITSDQWRLYLAVHTTAPLALARALAPPMTRRGWGRIVNVTTSLGTMLNAGFPTYGPSKAALEAMSAIWAKDLAGSGVTVNVLVPGGVTDTPMISEEAGFDRARLIRPRIMVPPLLWLLSDNAAAVTGRRFIAAHWDTALSPAAAAAKAGAPVAWTQIAAQPIAPDR
ncbi:MAG TPA: SDR family oxidoreductase [Stellaceae bacterium]|nr:SDR family oxidoreductase [Stellaceae bacterium]